MALTDYRKPFDTDSLLHKKLPASSSIIGAFTTLLGVVLSRMSSFES